MGIFLRLLLLAFVLALLWRLLKMGLKQIGMRQSQQLDARDGVSQTSAQDPPHEVMVGCHVCGLHLPQSQAIIKGAHFVCAEHA